MSAALLKTLSMAKYERLLPRVFPGAVRFEIRDRGGDLYWRYGAAAATAEESDIDEDGTDTVVVWADGVQRPEHVRFGWHQEAEPNLANKNGLPASPFRTDR